MKILMMPMAVRWWMSRYGYRKNDISSASFFARHTAPKIRNSGGRLKGPKKRSAVQDEEFYTALTFLLDSKENSQ